MATSILSRSALAALVAIPFLTPFTPLSAQVPGPVYTLEDPSQYATGCTGPSICLCPVLLVGPLTGEFTLVPVVPSIGPIFEFTVENFSAMVISPAGTLHTFEGAGTYTVDLASELQEMVLDLVFDGAPATFASVGQVPLSGSFPGTIAIDVFSEISAPCLYDGLHIAAQTPIGIEFIRGDANEDGTVDISDAVGVLLLIFPPMPFPGPPECADAADVNDDGVVNIADPISLLNGLFGSGPPPAPPYPDCGPDPTADTIDCATHGACP